MKFCAASIRLRGIRCGIFCFLLLLCISVAYPENPESLALINGKIFTLEESQRWAEAVIVENSKITFIGSTENAEALLTNRIKTIDLKGAMVLPGFHDVHMHPLEARSEYVSAVLNPDDSVRRWLKDIQYSNSELPYSEWLLGWGFDLYRLLEAGKTPVELLDSLKTDRPIAIMEFTSHSVWVNSIAMELAGIDRLTEHPTGGFILKDKAGIPNGILLDAAGDLVFDLAFKPTKALNDIAYRGLLQGLEEVGRNGITSIVDARLYWKRGDLEAWDRALKEGKLSARTILSLWAYPGLDDEIQLKKLKSLYRNTPDSLLRVNQIKLYSDGVIHNTTAALLEPYKKYSDKVAEKIGTMPFRGSNNTDSYRSYFKEVENRGLNYFSKERLSLYARELSRAGFDMNIHAIGDRAVRESLDALENNAEGMRHRITHLEMVDDKDRKRFAELGIIADFQLAGDFTMPEYFEDVENLIGQRAYSMLPVRDIYDTGAVVTLSSDWDVSTLNPFVGIQNALTRGPQSLPDLESALRAYTINGAYLMRQDDKTGSIKKGKWGDFVVIDQNLFEIDTHDIEKTSVLLTILGGKIIYDSGNLDYQRFQGENY